MPSWEEVSAALSGPGGPFESEVSDLHGRPMRHWKGRERSLENVLRGMGKVPLSEGAFS